MIHMTTIPWTIHATTTGSDLVSYLRQQGHQHLIDQCLNQDTIPMYGYKDCLILCGYIHKLAQRSVARGIKKIDIWKKFDFWKTIGSVNNSERWNHRFKVQYFYPQYTFNDKILIFIKIKILNIFV